MKMKKRTLLTLTALAISHAAFAGSLFDGKWSGEEKNEDGLSQLTLVINQNNETLTGSYCFITRDGARIDCPDDGTKNLHGSVKGNLATIAFDSAFGGKNGRATLQLVENKITWSLIQPPVNGEYYAPQAFTMKKIDEKKLRTGTTRKFSTDKFSISVTNRCGDFNTQCDDMFYLGVRNKDNGVITLKGETVQDVKTDSVTGAVFKNGDVLYLVDFAGPRLVVKQNDKILTEQSGRWIN